MPWQQFVFAGGAVCFAIALWPSIRSGNKPDIKTSVLTATWLTAYLIVYVTLAFWFAVVFETFCVAGWWILAWQMRKDWRTLPFMPQKTDAELLKEKTRAQREEKYETWKSLKAQSLPTPPDLDAEVRSGK